MIKLQKYDLTHYYSAEILNNLKTIILATIISKRMDPHAAMASVLAAASGSLTLSRATFQNTHCPFAARKPCALLDLLDSESKYFSGPVNPSPKLGFGRVLCRRRLQSAMDLTSLIAATVPSRRDAVVADGLATRAKIA